MEETLAWTQGSFLFRNATIETVIHQLRRWYALEVDYKGGVQQHFNVSVPRREGIQRVLQLLEGAGYVHFRLEGRKLIVRP